MAHWHHFLDKGRILELESVMLARIFVGVPYCLNHRTTLVTT